MVSRRALIGAGSAAAIACGLGGRESASDGVPETSWAGGAAGLASDRRLSTAFRKNAYGFYRAANANQLRFPNNALYPLAIAIELSLNAYLFHRSVSADRNRTYIRHELRKAVTYAENAGSRLTPGGLADVASSVAFYYERHALHRRVSEILAPEDVPQAFDTVRALQRGIDRLIDHETAKYSWMVRPRRDDAHA